MKPAAHDQIGLIVVLNLHNLPRVQFFGQFIRSISIKIDSRWGWIHPDCIKQFTTAVQHLHLPLLPHLSTLEYNTSGFISNTFVIWHNSPLTELMLTVEGMGKVDCVPLIESIRHNTSLVPLGLWFLGCQMLLDEIRRCSADVLKLLCNLTQITAASDDIFAPSVWVCIAQLPKLEKVSSPRKSGRPFPTDWHQPPNLTISFPSLHTLEAAIPH